MVGAAQVAKFGNEAWEKIGSMRTQNFRYTGQMKLRVAENAIFRKVEAGSNELCRLRREVDGSNKS